MKTVTLMINSTFYDMLSEYNYFLKDVFPELKEICLNHNINLEYKDVAFSVPKKEASKRMILQDLRFLDLDRTFFICFRGQRLGWKPTPEDIDGLTLDEYPELVDFIGNVSITELAIMHALKPFDKNIDGVLTPMPTVKHSLFFFRDPSYIHSLNDNQKLIYGNELGIDDKEVQDMEIAKSKDLICITKREYDKIEDNGPRVQINHYKGKWDESGDSREKMHEYISDFEKLNQRSLREFVEIHDEYLVGDTSGCLTDFTCDGKTLKQVMIDEIIEELKFEFPQNFQ